MSSENKSRRKAVPKTEDVGVKVEAVETQPKKSRRKAVKVEDVVE